VKDENGVKTIITETAKLARNFILFRVRERDLVDKYLGYYLLVNSEDSAFLSDVKGSVLEKQNSPYSFIGVVGCPASKMSVLMLSTDQKPEGFDDVEDIAVRPISSIPHKASGLYVCNRRWVRVPLNMREGRGYRTEYFLIDTGSPISFIKESLIRDVHFTNKRVSGPLYQTCQMKVEGVLVEFNIVPDTNENVSDANLYEKVGGINLLGTDFLNSVILIDDFGSKQIMILKRHLESAFPI